MKRWMVAAGLSTVMTLVACSTDGSKAPVYDTGYQSAASLDYAPLPEKLRQRLIDRIGTIGGGGA